MSLFKLPYYIKVCTSDVICIGVSLTTGGDQLIREAREYVSSSELERASKFLHSIDATRHIVGRALIRSFVATIKGDLHYKKEFLCNRWGKPELHEAELHFSISHSRDMVVVACCKHTPVGIDVEQEAAILRNSSVTIEDMLQPLHQNEQRYITELHDKDMATGFSRCWVRKEAVVKALGEGLHRPLNSFEVSVTPCQNDWLRSIASVPAPNWTTIDIELSKDYHCSLAANAVNLSTSYFFLN